MPPLLYSRQFDLLNFPERSSHGLDIRFFLTAVVGVRVVYTCGDTDDDSVGNDLSASMSGT
jgi:hypothetical protein